MATLEEDLEEEQMNSESASEKARKAQEQADQMSSDISQYQANVSKLEKAKSQLEKQVRFASRVISNSRTLVIFQPIKSHFARTLIIPIICPVNLKSYYYYIANQLGNGHCRQKHHSVPIL